MHHVAALSLLLPLVYVSSEIHSASSVTSASSACHHLHHSLSLLGIMSNTSCARTADASVTTIAANLQHPCRPTGEHLPKFEIAEAAPYILPTSAPATAPWPRPRPRFCPGTELARACPLPDVSSPMVGACPFPRWSAPRKESWPASASAASARSVGLNLVAPVSELFFRLFR